ncbi:MAG: hypothetical protein AB7Q81_17815 [Gammaproteobacteria bacterium]
MDETGKRDFFGALFQRGLGEFPMLRRVDDAARIGALVMNKGQLVFKDRGVLNVTKYAEVAPCWDLGLLGAITDLMGEQWESLSFVGIDRCEVKVDLSSTRHNVLGRIVAATGENVLDFKGSVYRGFQLMLDAGLLPIVLPLPIATRENTMGLAVTDFRFATVPLEALIKVNDLVRHAVDEHLTLDVHEVDMDAREFAALFERYHDARR